MSYNADSIEQLTFREGCRKRIGIYRELHLVDAYTLAQIRSSKRTLGCR